MKNIPTLLTAGSLLLASALPAFAFNYNFGSQNNGLSVRNTANITSASMASSDTGNNYIDTTGSGGVSGFSLFGGHHNNHNSGGTNTIMTGDATSNASSLVSDVNQTTLPSSGGGFGGFSIFGGHHGSSGGTKVTNSATIDSSAGAMSETGWNTIVTGGGGTNLIQTGMANSTSSSTVQNVNVTGFGMEI
jgi:hypothetical protein